MMLFCQLLKRYLNPGKESLVFGTTVAPVSATHPADGCVGCHNTVRAGGAPAGVAPSYYDLYCALQVLPRDANWRQILAPDITPEKILQTV
jgi:hypothetical protein